MRFRSSERLRDRDDRRDVDLLPTVAVAAIPRIVAAWERVSLGSPPARG